MNTKLFCLSLGFFLLSAAIAYGQVSQSGESIVVFDPLFWKDKLRLDDFQCKKIKNINIEYYERLYAIGAEPNRQTVQAEAAQSLLQRSEEIWETFYPKQRKRWKRMWQQNYVPQRSNET